MDVVEKIKNERQRVIGIYWDSDEIEIVDNTIAEEFTYVSDLSMPGLINTKVFEAGLWDDLMECDPEAYDILF